MCANAGIDHSNVAGEGNSIEDWVLLLPENPDESANKHRRQELEAKCGVSLGVMIIDCMGELGGKVW